MKALAYGLRRRATGLAHSLLLCLLSAMAAPALAADDAYWLELDKATDRHPAQVLQDAVKALRQAQQSGDRPAELKALIPRVDSARKLNRYSALPELAGRGVELARELGETDTLCYFLEQHAWQLALAREDDLALAALDEAATLAEQNRLDRRLGRVHAARAQVFMHQRRESDTLASIMKAHPILQAHQDKGGVAHALKILGRTNTGLTMIRPSVENLQKSIAYYQQALAEIDPDTYRVQTATLNYSIGNTYLWWDGKHANARKFLERALAIYENIGSSDALYAKRELGKLAVSEGRFSEALAYYDSALLDAQKTDSGARAHAILGILLARSNVFINMDRLDESLESARRAERLLPELRKTQTDIIYHELAQRVYGYLGDYKKAYDEMFELQQASIRHDREAGSRLTEAVKARLDAQLKESENARLRAQQKEAEARQKEAEAKRLAVMLAMALALVLLGGLAFYLRKRALLARSETLHHQAIAEAEARANQAKSSFLANMSHELRSPLNAMLGFTRLLMRSARLPQDEKADLGVILKSGEHLYTLINQVLDLSKIEAGHAALQERHFDLHELLDELQDTFMLAAGQKGVRLAVESAAAVPRHVSADMVRLRQVLTNLLANAIKFTREGSVTLRVARVGGDGPDEDAGRCRLSFTVSDTGVGIAPEELGQLGCAFVQAQAGRQSLEGTGLGLAISRDFVQLMGGEFRIASEPGSGTSVSFDIPLRMVDASSIANSAAGKDCRVAALAPGQPRYRILAVDDQPESRQLLVRLLAPLGFDVREAGNGEEALALYAFWQPHLILMDMRMPVMGGREATRRIRADESGWPIVIVALTASSFEDEREQILADGCDDFLRKPFREELLFELMRKHLGVEFVHEDESPAAIAHRAAALTLSGVPAVLCARLRAALVQLDVDAIDDAIDAIRGHDAGIGEVLAELADSFEYGRMRQLLGDGAIDAESRDFILLEGS